MTIQLHKTYETFIASNFFHFTMTRYKKFTKLQTYEGKTVIKGEKSINTWNVAIKSNKGPHTNHRGLGHWEKWRAIKMNFMTHQRTNTQSCNWENFSLNPKSTHTHLIKAYYINKHKNPNTSFSLFFNLQKI